MRDALCVQIIEHDILLRITLIMSRTAPHAEPLWVAVSGGFDPLHIGHVRMFKEARALGDKLVVIVNNDHWLRDKKGYSFMPQEERLEIIGAFPFVDDVVLTSHHPEDPRDAYHRGVSRELIKIEPAIFANGGDRDEKNAANPESSLYWDIQTCTKLGIQMIFNVGYGGKVQSSSWMIKNAVRGLLRSERPWGEFYDWDDGTNWHLKTLIINPHSRLSLQYHHHRAEYWMLVEGEASAMLGKTEKSLKRIALKPFELTHVPVGMLHRLLSEKGGKIVEVAEGAFDEKDIVRLGDDYHRVPTTA